MTVPGRRRAVLAGLGGLGAAALGSGLAACSQEPLTTLPAMVFGAPAELKVYGPDGAAAQQLAERLWARMRALDAEWLKSPAAADTRLAALLDPAGSQAAANPALPAETTGRDVVWRGFALDEAARVLGDAKDRSALLSLGQHVLALGERSFRPWHVGVPDPEGGHVLVNFDLYADERLVTVARYALYRSRTDPGHLQALGRAPGKEGCASCSVILRGEQGTRAAAVAVDLFGSTRGDWPARAAALGAEQVLWVGEDGQADGSTLFVKRAAMADQRRTLRERR